VHRLWFRVMKLFGAVVVTTLLLTTPASSQSPAFDLGVRDSTRAIRAFTEASRAGVSVNSLDRKAVEAVTRNVDPTTERIVGYVAIAAGVIAVTILLIGFYKLAKLLGG